MGQKIIHPSYIYHLSVVKEKRKQTRQGELFAGKIIVNKTYSRARLNGTIRFSGQAVKKIRIFSNYLRGTQNLRYTDECDNQCTVSSYLTDCFSDQSVFSSVYKEDTS